MAGGALAGITAATYIPVSQSPMNNIVETINLGEGDVQYNFSELDTHIIAIGTRENCSLELWLLPSKYKSVADALYYHKDAKPKDSYVNESNDWNCDRNADKKDPFNKQEAYNNFGSGVTGIHAKDSANYRKA